MHLKSNSVPTGEAVRHDGETPRFDDLIAPSVRFELLGPLVVDIDGTNAAPTAPLALQLLALLLLRPNRVVPPDTIIEELWGNTPPRRAVSAVQNCVYQVRRRFAEHGLSPDPKSVLGNFGGSYLIRVDPRRMDVSDFTRDSRAGVETFALGHVEEAATLLRDAEELWTGPPLVNVRHGSMLSAEVNELLERRHAVRSTRIEAEIALGRHRELVGELGSLAAAYPLDETVHAQYVRVLDRCGRRSDAMRVFHDYRRLLRAELGIEPGGDLRAAYTELLSG